MHEFVVAPDKVVAPRPEFTNRRSKVADDWSLFLRHASCGGWRGLAIAFERNRITSMTELCPTASAAITLTNARSRQVIARDVEVALTVGARGKRLFCRSVRRRDSAVVLAPCFAVHTAFRRFAIDVVFVDRAGAVQHIVRRLQPWRMAASRGAYATIEFTAGALELCDVVVGDRLCLGVSMSMKLSNFLAEPAFGREGGL